MSKNKPIYLYIKTHNKTGLKYFGKTVTKNPYSYVGSGKYWREHLKKHGRDISTEILNVYYDEKKCLMDAIEFSIKNNIVESKEWANLKIETLDGGDTSKTDGYIKALPKISQYHKKSKWWNNGKHQTFSENPPDHTYVRGRLNYTNNGSKIGANIQRGKIWVNNTLDEMMVYPNKIPNGYIKGRLKEKCFSGGKKRHKNNGTCWWNNGVNECMSFTPPDSSYKKGRINNFKSQSQNQD